MNERLWCIPLGAWVRVLEHRELFGRRVARIVTDGDEVRTVPAESLTTARPVDLPEALSVVAAARIWHALGSDLFLAPVVSRVVPLPHQFRVLRRALAEFPVRLLLADEVGLGKTIEAGLILKELKLRGLVERVLVLAPKSLLLQWVAEMDLHFGEWFDLVEPGSWGVGDSRVARMRGENPWKRRRQVVTSFDAVKPRSSQKGWSTEKIERFNLERFHDLVGAGWDLVIIDESHKVAGAGDDVARYELAGAVAKAAPHLLLLSATPHSGKSDSFRRLLTLLDPIGFPAGTPVTRERVAPFVIRTEKRTTTDADGKPLFAPRSTRLLAVPFQPGHHLQQRLYEEISEYVVEGYNRAGRSDDQGSRLLLLLIQRLMSSSTRAVRRFLEGRLEGLAGGKPAGRAPSVEAEDDAEPDELVQLVLFTVAASGREGADVRRLLELAVQVEAAGPDARAEALYEQMLAIAREDGEPGKKFLVFTEFTATQEMLREFLEQRGYPVALLNGGMDLDERRAAQERFRGDAQVLLSTDAGGEGLNLQFANVVINYDLPWNPMRLEQRIGRVDRIGQTQAVRAINLALENSVEARVYEVLTQKLEVILREFGVDKAGDVLDSREAGARFEDLARTALLQPATFETEAERLLVEIRRAAEEASAVRALYTGAPEAADRLPAVPLRAWLHTLTANSEVPPPDAPEADLSEVALERIHALRAHFAPGRPVPWLRLEGLGFELTGWFSLWKVGIADGQWRQQHVFELCTTDAGASYAKSARRIWEELAAGRAAVQCAGMVEEYDYPGIERRAEQEAEALYQEVVRRSAERARRRLTTLELSRLARRSALEQIGLESARQARQRELEEEYRRRRLEITAAAEALPDLRCLFLAKVNVR